MHHAKTTTLTTIGVAAGLLLIGSVLAAPPTAGGVSAAGSSPTPTPTIVPPPPPPEPTDVRAGTVTATSIQVVWSGPTQGTVGSFYVSLIAQTLDSSTYRSVVLPQGSAEYRSRSAVFGGLQPGTAYRIQVSACAETNGSVCTATAPITVRTLKSSGGQGCTLHGPPPICQ